MTFWVWAGVALLGGISALARFGVDAVFGSHAGRAFPYGTLAVNASASFLLGLVTGLALTGDALLLAGTATIGSYSTFSTWILETHRLAEDGETGAAAVNLVVSVGVGVGAAAIGRLIGTGL
ncbi:MAG TPA: fluoride efflux transporter CrcB [Solirubrobacteraceae bacterium]|jgi:CrcB protein|nr:fluoride efflux transporter CrcB [Solirubrobacteraceae bacterium]